MTDFNLEDEFGWLLDGVTKYVDENPEEFLAHYGVKGMKWGVRKEVSTSKTLVGLGPSEIVRKTASGETLTMTKEPPNAIHKALGKMSSKYRESYNSSASLTIRDGSGKKIGDANVHKKNDEELYLNWLGINKDSRGKGYATAVMRSAEEFGKESGFKKMTLEVPGNSPDARHIYEKLGFKVVKEEIDEDDFVWGGLTSMEYSFDEIRQSSSFSSNKFKNTSGAKMGTDEVDAFLAHYGVKGMKWGKRKGGLKERVKGARLDQNQRRTAIAKRAAADKGTLEERLVNAPFKMVMGEKAYKKSVNQNISNLADQRERINKGKSTVMDHIETLNSITLLDLAVSRQDNKG